MATQVGKPELSEPAQILVGLGHQAPPHSLHLVHHKEVFLVRRTPQLLRLSAAPRKPQALATMQILAPVYSGLSNLEAVSLAVRQPQLLSQLTMFSELLDRLDLGPSKIPVLEILAPVFLEILRRLKNLPLVISGILTPIPQQVPSEPPVAQTTCLVLIIRLAALEPNHKLQIPLLLDNRPNPKTKLDSVVDLAAIITALLLDLPCLGILLQVRGGVIFSAILAPKLRICQDLRFSEIAPPSQTVVLFSGTTLQRQGRRISLAPTTRPLRTIKVLRPLADSGILIRINKTKVATFSARTIPQSQACLVTIPIIETVYSARITTINRTTREAVSSEHQQIIKINKTRPQAPLVILLWVQQASSETVSSKISYNHPADCQLHC